MKYSDYKVDDFLKDDFFVSWVKSKDLHAEKFWKKWLLENPDKYDVVNEASQVINSIQYEQTHQLDDKEYITLYENIVNASRVIKTPQEESFKNSYRYGIAASIVLLIASWFIINNWIGLNNVTAPVSMVTKVVSNGQKMTVRLSDGTSIKLNSNSKIIYPESFSSQERHVQLEGEAFFDVAKDSSRPFTITSGEVSTTVLGTSFNVRAFPESKNIKVSVLTGKVKVDAVNSEGEKKELILFPDDMAVYSQKSQRFEKTSFSQLQEMAWKDGVLHFQDMNIYEVTSELTKWYGVSFDINKAVDTQKDYTGSFNNQPLEEVLKGLSFVFGFDFKIDNKTVTIK